MFLLRGIPGAETPWTARDGKPLCASVLVLICVLALGGQWAQASGMQHSSLVTAIVRLLLTGVSVVIVAWLLPGVRVKSYRSAVAFAFVVGLLNAFAWSFLAPLTLTFTVLTLGVGALIVNAVLFLVAGAIVKGVEISGCFTAALASLGVTFVNWLMHFVVGHWAP